jgi:hypothetical protein
MLFESPLNDCTLDAVTAPVDQSDLAQTRSVCLDDVLGYDRGNVGRREGVKVEGILDWNAKRVLILHGIEGLYRSFVSDGDLGFDAATNRKVADNGHAPRLTGGDEIVEDLIRDIFVENAFVAEFDQVVFQCLQFDTEPVGDVLDANLTEIRKPSFRTNRCELRTSDGNLVVAAGVRVGERFEGRA